MSTDKLIKTTLEAFAPTSQGTYTGDEDTYIIFNEYNQAAWLSADDEELWTKHFYQVDVFSSGNYNNLVKQLKKAMKEAGFGRMFESGTYESEMEKHRKILRFSYISKEED
ncbi:MULTISPECIES: hypothetical protein [unclassified Oceanobacillus]|uniref:hypothetical protein n=1 Tax=unclassified Oceanobacillus TaxID=2630292 RepID=UPI001BEC64D4|nr:MULTISPECIES: hypothetical protein [unclassified Oceanobacillus]MBT2600945.1 hypothetical protein [Oceanobacillus sp. ISL-74]MBT2653604.1 hypothetical protein [Oceanobacillus sp. ISL-73]